MSEQESDAAMITKVRALAQTITYIDAGNSSCGAAPQVAEGLRREP